MSDFPAIGLFRNGHFLLFEGDDTSDKVIMDWMTDEETLKIIGIIDEVNSMGGKAHEILFNGDFFNSRLTKPC